jgi:hypothetical protein
LGLTPGRSNAAGVTYWRFLRSNLHPASDGKTAAQSGKPRARLPKISARLVALWGRIPLSLRVSLAILSGLTMLLGLPGIAGDVADWWDLLSFVSASVGRYAVPIAGGAMLAAVLGLQFAEWRSRRQLPGVLGDIEHREDCPRDRAHMEVWTAPRERDGIEVTRGKCNDCGAMAYRHGDVPMESPPERERPASVERRPKPTPGTRRKVSKPPTATSQSPIRKSAPTTFVGRLAELYSEGEAFAGLLRFEYLNVPTEALTGIKARQAERERTVRDWDNRVHQALQDDVPELIEQWDSAASLPDNPPARALIKPTTTLSELRSFLGAKLRRFEWIMEQLDESPSDSSPEQESLESPPQERDRPAPPPSPKPQRPRTPSATLKADLLSLQERGRTILSVLRSGVIAYLGEGPEDWEGRVLNTLETAGRSALVNRFGANIPHDPSGPLLVPGGQADQIHRMEVLLGRLTKIVRDL